MDIYTVPVILNKYPKLKDFNKMNNANQFGKSIVMGALIMLTSASIITIMNMF
jgi:hypothetical protein